MNYVIQTDIGQIHHPHRHRHRHHRYHYHAQLYATDLYGGYSWPLLLYPAEWLHPNHPNLNYLSSASHSSSLYITTVVTIANAIDASLYCLNWVFSVFRVVTFIPHDGVCSCFSYQKAF